MTSDLADLMNRATRGLDLDARAPGDAIQAYHSRRRRRRRRGATGALVLVLGIGIGAGAAAWPSSNDDQLSSIHAVQPTAAPDPLLNGPTGPSNSTIFGRAYPVGTATNQTGQPVTVIAFETDFVKSPTRSSSSELCYAIWQPGHALTTARIFQCSEDNFGAAVVFLPITADGFTYVGSKEVKDVNIISADLVASLPRSVTRAELIVARTSDVPEQPPAHADDVKTQRLLVRLLGADDTTMPALIGAVSPLPPDYIVLGLDAWNSQGQRVIHELTNSYCGPSPAGVTRYPISIPRRPLAC